MNNKELVEAQKFAAAAYADGARIAEQNAKYDRTKLSNPIDRDLGNLLDDPVAFWSKAAAVEAFGDGGELVVPLMLANRVASAQIAVGNFDFIRDSLIGQAQWLSVVAIKMMTRAESMNLPDHSAQSIKLALAAQRQAAQCLASAAALDKLSGSSVVTVG